MLIDSVTEIKDLTDLQVRDLISAVLAPRVDVSRRMDMREMPRQVYVEFCGFELALFVTGRMTVNDICGLIRGGFERTCNPPGFFQRLWSKIRGKK